MKFGKVGQVGLVTASALAVATLFTACGTLNVGFLFVATNKQTPGQIEVYEVNSESGSLRTIPTSPFPSGGRNPIAEVVSPDYKDLYVVNQDDNNIVQMTIGTDGKLYAQATINTPGSFPLAVTVNAAGTFLYVVDTLQPTAGCSLSNLCPGAIAGYAVTSAATAATSGSLGEGSLGQVCVPPVAPATVQTCTLGNAVTNSNGLAYVPLLLSPTDKSTVLTPTAVNVLTNSAATYVYVSAYNASTSAGYLFGFSTDSTGTLTALNGGIPFSSGEEPFAMISDSAGSYLYVVDKLKRLITSYAVQSNGTLTAQSTVSTGSLPSALTFFRSNFLYVTNSGDSNVTSYSISSGTLTRLATNASDNQPIAIISDPRQLGFLYTVNFLGSSLSGFQVDPTTGALINTQKTPYASSVQPTAIAGIPHQGAVVK